MWTDFTMRGVTAMTRILQHQARVWTVLIAGWVLIFLTPFHVTAQEKRLTNSLNMTFVLIPAGTFTMGSSLDEQGRRNDEIEHEVSIGRPFYMQTTEVTVKQWRAVMGTRFFFKKKGTDDMPVVKVSWDDCMEFVKKLNDLNEGVYRLPTEAEWEYACKGGGASVYGWGDTIDCSKAMYANNTLKTDTCVKFVQSKGLPTDQPAPVKSYAPNGWGLYDMTGNAWEWCQDWYGPYSKEPVVDPKGPASGSDKVRRGGSWYGLGSRCRCANRNFSHPANRYQTTGFRLVREAE
ncbi:MAG: formylglycine-generating enzyme family protein [Deltaproteobacteria bacterium]|nr:formylglycine-generating enzyme family protein [Deltaproteobacteria bacterium]